MPFTFDDEPIILRIQGGFGGSPAGSGREVQFNDAGGFGADPDVLIPAAGELEADTVSTNNFGVKDAPFLLINDQAFAEDGFGTNVLTSYTIGEVRCDVPFKVDTVGDQGTGRVEVTDPLLQSSYRRVNYAKITNDALLSVGGFEFVYITTIDQSVTFTLDDAVDGRIVEVVRRGPNAATIEADVGDNIEGSGSLSLADGESARLVYRNSGSEWLRF